MINDCTSSKVLFKISEYLRSQDQTIALPKIVPPEALPDKFCTFFHNKVVQIKESLDNDHGPRSLPTSEPFQGEHCVAFQSVSCETVKNIIKACPPKSCHLDPIATSFVHNHIDDLVPLITTIVNASLSEGAVSSCFKVASVSPLLKKPGLDPHDMKNYRPVSHLPFLSKVLEKIVLSQLKYHLSKNQLFEPFQSEYSENHSTETALLRMCCDLLNAADEGIISVLLLLDLSAAFDTLDHKIMLNRLSDMFGLSGCVLDWFR